MSLWDFGVDAFVFPRIYQAFCAGRLTPYPGTHLPHRLSFFTSKRLTQLVSDRVLLRHIKHPTQGPPSQGLILLCHRISIILRRRRRIENALHGESMSSRSDLWALYLFGMRVLLFLNHLGRHRLRCGTYETLEFPGRDTLLEHLMDFLQGAAPCFRHEEVYEQEYNSV